MSSRLTARAKALSFIFFLNDAGLTLAIRLSGRTSATAPAKPVTRGRKLLRVVFQRQAWPGHSYRFRRAGLDVVRAVFLKSLVGGW